MSAEGKPRIGFIGIGLMGEAMVRRLLDKGWAVTVWNLEPERLATVVPHGAVAAASPAAVAAVSDFVLICVLHAEAVRRCVLGEYGIANASRQPRLVIDLSTADPAETREIAAQLKSRCGAAFMDAPVSGGPPAARTGTLTVMAGGAPADVEAARPMMQDLAANFTVMGPVGAGQTTKIVNQAIVGAGYAVMAEAVTLAEAAGVAVERLPACLAGGAADSALLRSIFPQMHERAFEPPRSFARQLLKDLVAVVKFAEAQGVELAIVAAARDLYRAHVDEGHGLQDSASVIRRYDVRR